MPVPGSARFLPAKTPAVVFLGLIGEPPSRKPRFTHRGSLQLNHGNPFRPNHISTGPHPAMSSSSEGITRVPGPHPGTPAPWLPQPPSLFVEMLSGRRRLRVFFLRSGMILSLSLSAASLMLITSSQKVSTACRSSSPARSVLIRAAGVRSGPIPATSLQRRSLNASHASRVCWAESTSAEQ